MLDSHTTVACPPRLSKRTLVRALLLALLIAAAVAALPAMAQAAPANDDFFDAVRINAPGTALASFSAAGDSTDADPLPQPGEYDDCGGILYGATTWYWFFPHVRGQVHITVVTSGVFDNPVASLVRWSGDGDPGTADDQLIEGNCNGPVAGLDRTDVPINGFIEVAAGQQYAIQVGGAQDGGGVPDEGPYSVFLVYDPDSDGDGIFDSSDECDNQPGPAVHGGCPDSDGDNIADRNDLCPTAAGTPTHRGCPDADGDSVPEPPDNCPTVNPNRVNRNDRNRDGCPDNLRIAANTKQLVAPRGNGIIIGEFFVTGVPKGSRVVVKCKRPNGRTCGKLLVKRASTASGLSTPTGSSVRAQAARRLAIHRRISKTLPYGSTITIRVTARFAIGRFIRVRVVPGKLISKQFLCIKPGTKKPRRRGCG